MSQMQTISHAGERLYSLQILRGLAAVAVLMFHVERYTKIMGGVNDSIFNHVPLLFGQGAFWFFEISGFIMAYLIDRNLNKNFLLQRAVRIYPPYFLAVSTSIFLYVMFLGAYTVSRWDLIQALTLLPVGQIKYVLGVEWSLTYEIFFYMLCAIWAIGPLKKYYLHFLIVWFLTILWFRFPQENMLLEIHQIPISQYNYYFIVGGFIYYLNKHKKNCRSAPCLDNSGNFRHPLHHIVLPSDVFTHKSSIVIEYCLWGRVIWSSPIASSINKYFGDVRRLFLWLILNSCADHNNDFQPVD